MQDNKDKDLYTIAVLRYKEEHPELDEYNLFPIEWNLSSDYYLKNVIIAQAIKNHVLVENTELYHENFDEKKKTLL